MAKYSMASSLLLFAAVDFLHVFTPVATPDLTSLKFPPYDLDSSVIIISEWIILIWLIPSYNQLYLAFVLVFMSVTVPL